MFPVPDGDTGTNMLLTLQSAVEDIRESPATEVGKIARIAAHGSLMGARGNSGVILSQIFRGFANAVQGKVELSPAELGTAFEEAANAAYRAVIKPTEGTILTVAREAGRAAVGAGREPGSTSVDVIKEAARAARAAVERTPTQLRILREAGVVDAGGYGLQIMLEGMVRSIEEVDPEHAPQALPKVDAAQAVLDLPEEGWGYCTEFLVAGHGIDVDKIREEIAALGNSVLVVGDPELIKVHVHTDDPSRVITLASGHGRIERLNVGDMSSQHRRLREEGAGGPEPAAEPDAAEAGTAEAPPAGGGRPNGQGIVAVVAGDGMAGIFHGLGADVVVEGGQTMNPSTQELLEAVQTVTYDEVLLLPNNKNVVLAARQVPELSEKRVHVVETLTTPQGIAAVVAFSPERGLEDNLTSMAEAATHVQTIEVTRAIRDSRPNGKPVRKGDVIALVNDHLEEVGNDYSSVVTAALSGLGVGEYELVTIYRGQEVSEEDAEALSAMIKRGYPDLEVELQAGGQEHYPYILSVE